MTIINIRGTSGSGKTFLIRRLLARMDSKMVYKKKDLGPKKSEKVIGYRYALPGQDKDLYLVGNYSNACGGCDTLSYKGGTDDIFTFIKVAVKCDMHVLFEGLTISGSSPDRMFDLLDHTNDVHVLFLNTELHECLEAINSRRRVRNPDAEDVCPDNTARKHASMWRIRERLQEGGVNTYWMDREGCYRTACELLNLE